MNNISRIAFFTLLAFLLVPYISFAHGEGVSYEQTVGAFLVDVGYSSPAPVAGESVVFDFKLSAAENASGADVEFSSVWVRVESENATVLATGINNPEFGGPRLSYVFSEEGEYTIFARFENGADSLAEVSFPLTVVPQPGEEQSPAMPWNIVYGIVGVVIGLVLSVAGKKYLRF